LEKKDQHYQELLRGNEGKYLESLKAVKERNKYLEGEQKQMEEAVQEMDSRIKSLGL
jgi:hypothetical protein